MTISLTIATAICLSLGLGFVARHVAMSRMALQSTGVRSRRSRQAMEKPARTAPAWILLQLVVR